MSLALALLLTQHPAVSETLGVQILTVTAGIVLLTIGVNGTSTGWLLDRLGLTHVGAAEALAEAQAARRVLSMVAERVEDAASDPSLRTVPWQSIRTELAERQRRLDRDLDVAIERRTIAWSIRKAQMAGASTQALTTKNGAEWMSQHRAALTTASDDLSAVYGRLQRLAGEHLVDTVLALVAAIPTHPHPLPVCERAPTAVFARRRADRDAKCLLAWALLPTAVEPTIRLTEVGPVLQIQRDGNEEVVDLSGDAIRSVTGDTGAALALIDSEIEIRSETTGARARVSDPGVMATIHLHGGWKFDRKWRLWAETDLSYGGGYQHYDGSIFLEYRFNRDWDVAIGLRGGVGEVDISTYKADWEAGTLVLRFGKSFYPRATR